MRRSSAEFIGCRGLLQFSHPGSVQERWSREVYDMRATLQRLKFLQLDSGRERDKVVFVSSFCYLHLRCVRMATRCVVLVRTGLDSDSFYT